MIIGTYYQHQLKHDRDDTIIKRLTIIDCAIPRDQPQVASYVPQLCAKRDPTAGVP